MGTVVDLFTRQPIATDDAEFWAWGEQHAGDVTLNLQAITEDLTNATTEVEFKAALQEMKDEIARIPSLT